MYKNFNNYDVLLDGRIWSKKRNKFLTPSKKRDGYLQVCLLDNNGKKHNQYVHKVVFFAVNGIWSYPKGYEINHRDEDKTNNHIDNLELVTKKQNLNWGTRNERSAKARMNDPKRSKRVAAFNENGELIMIFDSTKEAQRNGYDSGHVSKCCLGKVKTHKGFTWKYLEE